MKSEFQDVFKDAYDHWIDDACSQRYYASRNLALQVWKNQQSKVDELQKKNAWLSDVACRENKRANKLQEENVNTTVLLGKTIQEKNEIQKQHDSFIKDYEVEIDKSEELQKKLDEQTRHIEIALLAVKDIYKSAIDEFHGWDVLNEKAPKPCEHLQNLSVAIGELEQALKGC